MDSYENALTNGLKRIYDLGEQSESVVQEYLGPISDHYTPSFYPGQTDDYSLEQEEDLEGKKTLHQCEEDWLTPLEQPSALEEEPEIRPILEIDLNEPKTFSEQSLEPKNLLLVSPEKEMAPVVIPELSFEENFSPSGKNPETILFGKEENGRAKEKLLAYSSLEEILLNECAFEEDTENPSPENEASIMTENQAHSRDSSSSLTESLTEVDTIKLLTDLLEEGALDNVEEEELSESNDYSPEVFRAQTENLLPNTGEEMMKTPELTKNLTPDKLKTLEKDLADFGGETIPQEPELKLYKFPSPWDDQ